jgi:very-short-patch-repair endonuclease
MGVTRHEIATRLQAGRLTELHRGVYLVGAVPSEHTYAQAALLALKGKGTLSHFSATHIWRLRDYPSLADPWVTADLSGGLTRPRVHLHRAALEKVDVRHRHGLDVTSPPRTVLDCASLYTDVYEYEALVAEARFRGLADEDEMRRQAERNPRKRGVAMLREVLDLPGGARMTRSKGERAFLRLLRDEKIEGYETNSKAFGPELDFVWQAERFAVEVDGWDGHSGKIAFERDKVEDCRIAGKGCRSDASDWPADQFRPSRGHRATGKRAGNPKTALRVGFDRYIRLNPTLNTRKPRSSNRRPVALSETAL